MTKHLVCADHRRIDCRGLHHRALGGNITCRERHRRADAAPFCLVRSEDHLIRRDPLDFLKMPTQPAPPLGVLPPVKILAEGRPRHRQHILMQKSSFAEMEHYLWHTARHEGKDCRIVDRTDRQNAHQARYFLVDARPVGNRRYMAACCMSNRGEMQQKIGRSAEGRMHRHCVLDCLVRQDVLCRNAARSEFHHSACRRTSNFPPDLFARWSECRMGQCESKPLSDHL